MKRKYLMPCSGYMGSVPRHRAPLSALTVDSRNVVVDAVDGTVSRRRGTKMVGDLGYAPTGLWESSTQMIGRHLFPLEPGLSDPLREPFLTSVVTKESAGSRWGQIFVRAFNANYTFGEEFGSTHYPTAASTAPQFKMVPLPYITKGSDTGGTASYALGYTRCAFEFARRYTAQGTRRVTRDGMRYLFPNANGCPFMWDGKFNTSTSSGTVTLRARPWGHYPPLFPPLKGTTAASTGSDANWTDGDAFYASVIFEDENGDYSAPFIPRPVSATVTAAKGGLFIIGTPGGTSTYRSVVWDNVAIGPPGTRRRILCRTRKTRMTATTTPLESAPTSLFVTGVIDDNTTTSYTDPNGDDNLHLRSDPLVIRFDRIWPPAARVAFEFDQRFGVGGAIRRNPCALIVAPTGSSGSRDLNAADDGSIYGSIAWLVRIHQSTAGALTLQMRETSGWGTAGLSQGETAITLTGSLTLQDLVDQINATLFSGSASEWGCQLVPGPGSAFVPSTNLQPTAIEVSAVTIANTAGSITHASSGFAKVAIGMKCRVLSGVTTTNIPIDAVVIEKSHDGSITLGSVTGGAIVTVASGPAVVEFFVDTGDDAFNITDVANTYPNGRGNMRAYAASFPVVMAFTGTFVYSTPVDNRSVFFTVSNPGDAGSSGTAFVNAKSNRRGVEGTMGTFQGASTLHVGAVCWYSRGFTLLTNKRAGNTGEDPDYRMYTLSKKRGCIAYGSIVSGDNWAGAMTAEGYLVTDGVKSLIITRSLFDPTHPGATTTTRRGPLSFAIEQASYATSSDSSEFLDARIHACVHQHRLHLAYQSTSSTLGASNRMVYDFSGNADASGLEEVVKRVGASEESSEFFPWSPPLEHHAGAMAGMWTGEHGYALYAAVDYYSGITSLDQVPQNGRIDRLDTLLMDVDYGVLITASFAASSTILTGTFPSTVAVGSYIKNGTTNFQNATRVLGISSDRTQITVSLATTNVVPVNNQSVVVVGKDFVADAYCATDFVDSVKSKKQTHNLTVLHVAGQSNSKVRHSFDPDRLSQSEYQLPTTGTSAFARTPVELTQEARAHGDVVEVSWHNLGGFTDQNNDKLPELWGFSDVEIEVLDSVV